MKKFSLLGLVLIAASAVTSAFYKGGADTFYGKLIMSTGLYGNQITCVYTVNPMNCSITIIFFQSATTNGHGTSANINSSNGKHSSCSPV